MSDSVKFQLAAKELMNVGDKKDIPDCYFEVRDIEGVKDFMSGTK